MGVELNITEYNVNQYKHIHLNPICCHPPVSDQVIMLTILLFRKLTLYSVMFNSTPINQGKRFYLL
jgi:hypothetical protein